jgi:hypothetical protein
MGPNMIDKVMKSLVDKDYETLATYFSENCILFDYCPSMNGLSNSYIYGNACILMHFKLKFVTEEFDVAEPAIEDENRATFFGAYGGPYVYARMNIEEYDGSGLIRKAVVHPA